MPYRKCSTQREVKEGSSIRLPQARWVLEGHVLLLGVKCHHRRPQESERLRVKRRQYCRYAKVHLPKEACRGIADGVRALASSDRFLRLFRQGCCW